MDLGNGYFVGVKLDEPFGNSNGTIKGVKYFDAYDKYAIFVRPNAL
jgi:tubulin-folding cofactor B